MMFSKIFSMLMLATFTSTAFSITNDNFFSFAEVNYPEIFKGTAKSGKYYQYIYRFYPISGNYLAIDNKGVISIYGPYTNGRLIAVNTVAAYAPIIDEWVASRASAVAGKWIITSPTSGGTFTVGKDGKIASFSVTFPTPSGRCFSDIKASFTDIKLDLSTGGVTSSYTKQSSYATGDSASANISGTFTSYATFAGAYTAIHGIANSFGVCSSSGSGAFTALKQ